jgi:hypothetical protein
MESRVETSRMKLSLWSLLVLHLSGSTGFTPAATPSVIVIDSLAALADYAGRSAVRLKMQPGVYVLNDPAMARAAEVKHPEVPGKTTGTYRVNSLLHFAGNDSVYDLAGVVIEIDTKLHAVVRNPLDKVLVSGNRLIIRGLTVVDQGDTPPGRAGCACCTSSATATRSRT